MPSDAPPFAIHATAVAIGDWGLVIRGPSKAGKSTLALELIAASDPLRRIILVGDDRLLVSHCGAEVLVSPHPRIAGLIEQRGVGIIAMPYQGEVPVLAVVDLGISPDDTHGCVSTCDLAGQNFPSLQFVRESRWSARHARVLEWFVATSAAHCSLKCGMNLLHA